MKSSPKLLNTQGKNEIGVGSVINTSHQGVSNKRPTEEIVSKKDEATMRKAEGGDPGQNKKLESGWANPNFGQGFSVEEGN